MAAIIVITIVLCFEAPLTVVISVAIDNGKRSHGVNCIFPETKKHGIESTCLEHSL